MTEQHISKLDMKRLRRNSERKIGKGQESIGESIQIKENPTSLKNRVKFNWPLCNLCLQKTTDNTDHPGLTPQWVDDLWFCEDCLFKIYLKDYTWTNKIIQNTSGTVNVGTLT